MPAYYSSAVSEFLIHDDAKLESELTRGYTNDRYADLKTSQITVWRQQIQVLRRVLTDEVLAEYSPNFWGILIEFPIPRRMGRIDTVLLVGDSVVVLEFKSENSDHSAFIQVEDYALDLKYFHFPSHNSRVYPVVVGSDKAGLGQRDPRQVSADIEATRHTSPSDLARVLAEIAQGSQTTKFIDYEAWNSGAYHPVPTVIEAAVGMFQEMEVDDIAHADADVVNLTHTVESLRSVILDSATTGDKTVCFVTGVPGAGKTLAGLKLVHDSELRVKTSAEIAFLSGNGPLVTVLQGALARDLARRQRRGMRFARRDPKTSIQLVYSYKKTELPRDGIAPREKVIVFDEAQRAWNVAMTQRSLSDEMKQEYPDFSEPGLMLKILDRHKDWAVLVCLVGGGQEINTGEAGLPEWGDTLARHFKHWRIVASPFALGHEVEAGMEPLFLQADGNINRVESRVEFHLDNPTRQFRGRTVADWTEAVLTRDTTKAVTVTAENPEYPIMVTRDIGRAKLWVRQQARGSERFGLICSSGAKRLRADGITVPGPKFPDIEHWFLQSHEDVRSSFQMEIAATEFQIQGLEIDWATVCWGGDLSIDIDGEWRLREFRGTRWLNVKDAVHRQYIINTYRVLLTRARQGFVVYVPRGDVADVTHHPHRYDRSYEHLVRCGAKELL